MLETGQVIYEAVKERAVENLINNQGGIDFGLINEPVKRINHLEYALRTPTGRLRSGLARRLLFKQFVFIGISTPDLMAGVAVVDLQYAANGFFYVFDRNNLCLTEAQKTTPPWKVDISPFPEEAAAFFKTGALSVRLSGDRLLAESREMRLAVNLPQVDSTPLRICTPTGFRGWTFTRKLTPIPVSGSLRVKEKSYSLRPDSSQAIMDWTAGYLRRNTWWNWAAIATVLADSRRLGLNLACGVNETGATENAFWIDDHQVKVDSVKFVYDEQDDRGKWRITSGDGRVRLEFTPVADRGENLNALLVVSRFTQFLGFFSGILTDEAGNQIRLDDCPGWTEEHFARW